MQCVGVTLLWRGELAHAQAHLEQGIALYDPEHHALTWPTRWDRTSGLAALGYAALALWCLGYQTRPWQKSP